jgi:hypothetical protein
MATFDYTKMESRILETMKARKGKTVKIMELVMALYQGKRPKNARGSMAAQIRSLNIKMAANKSPWKIERTSRLGVSSLAEYKFKRV